MSRPPQKSPGSERAAEAAALHRDCLVFDAHVDAPIRLHEEPADLRTEVEGRHVDLPKLRRGGVDAVVFALYVPPGYGIDDGWELIERLHGLSEAQLGDGWRSASSARGVREIVGAGEIAVVYSIENGRSLARARALEQAAALGVRLVTLTHGASHEWCDASSDAPRHGGLSAEGRRIVAEMERFGILPDVAHVSEAAAFDTLDVARGPVIASHCSAAALCPHPGNVSNALAAGVAASGGVVMVNSHPAMLDPSAARANAQRWRDLEPALRALGPLEQEDPAAFAEELEALFEAHPLPPVGVETYARHLAHFVERIGADHVGIGTDFDGIPNTLDDLQDASSFPALTRALLDIGLDQDEVRAVLGENFLRVLAAAESSASASFRLSGSART